MENEWQLVHTMTDYYDGPRGGIANFEGQPHVYESLFDETKDEFSGTFRLWPIDVETLTLALESWAIWRRWETAFYEGRVSQDTHPALPLERDRYTQLDLILKNRLAMNSASYLEATAEFRVREDSTWSGRGSRPLEVIWTMKDKRRS